MAVPSLSHPIGLRIMKDRSEYSIRRLLPGMLRFLRGFPRAASATGMLLVAVFLDPSAFAKPAPTWVAAGPAPNIRGQVENVIPDGEVIGAIHAVTPHPTDPNTVYIGSVNGGVWKTENATAAHPQWVVLTDTQASLSIGALEFDPTDSGAQTLVAGVGRFSSLLGVGGTDRASYARRTAARVGRPSMVVGC